MFVLNKVGTDETPADAVTKGGDATAIQKDSEGVRAELMCDRHQIAPELEQQGAGAEFKIQDEG